MTSNANQVVIVSCCQGTGWGAEEVLEHYLRAGAEVSVAAPFNSRFTDLVKETGQTLYTIPTSRNTAYRNILAAFQMPGLDKIKLVHAWCARSVEFSYVLSKRLGVGLTVGLHDSPDQPYHSNSRRFLIKTICKRARCVATVSEAMAEKCRLLGLSENAYIALNGIPDIDLSCIESKPNRPPTVGFLGMNAARKGFFTVADWISKTNCPWRLYGDIDPVIEDKAYTLINSYGDRVTLCGRKPPADIYREVDIVVMPSVEFEPFGLVAVEAGRAGLPVVASEVGGLREILDHGKSGFLYPEDQPELGLQWIQLLCGDQKLSKKMGCEGRVNFEKNFTVSQMKNAWDLFFKEHQT